MDRIIREAKPIDITDIMQVMEAAKKIMRSSGNMYQWGDGYPTEAVIFSDMEKHGGYVIEDAGRIVAYFAFIPSPEPTYSKIYNGEWLDDTLPYHVIHRIASYPDVHGIFDSIMDFCFSHDENIRIDTHKDNSIMQHNIKKYGFTYCGIIYLASGDERLTYQKLSPEPVLHQKRFMKHIAFSFILIALLFCSCGSNTTKSEITAEMAYEGVNNYCIAHMTGA